MEPLALVPISGGPAVSQIFWHNTPSSLIRFDLMREDIHGINLFQFIFTRDGCQILPDNTHHSNFKQVSRADLVVDKTHWVQPGEYYLTIWNQFFCAGQENRKIFAQSVLCPSETGGIDAQRLVDFTPLDHTGNLGQFFFDPFSGRGGVLLDGGRVVMMEYLKVPDIKCAYIWIKRNII